MIVDGNVTWTIRDAYRITAGEIHDPPPITVLRTDSVSSFISCDQIAHRNTNDDDDDDDEEDAFTRVSPLSRTCMDGDGDSEEGRTKSSFASYSIGCHDADIAGDDEVAVAAIVRRRLRVVASSPSLATRLLARAGESFDDGASSSSAMILRATLLRLPLPLLLLVAAFVDVTEAVAVAVAVAALADVDVDVDVDV